MRRKELLVPLLIMPLKARSNEDHPLSRSQPSGKKGASSAERGQPGGSSLRMTVVVSRWACHMPVPMVISAVRKAACSGSVRCPSASFWCRLPHLRASWDDTHTRTRSVRVSAPRLHNAGQIRRAVADGAAQMEWCKGGCGDGEWLL